MNTIEKQVANLLKENNISFDTVFLSKGEKNGWDCYTFTCILAGESFEFNKGLGHGLTYSQAKQYVRKHRTKTDNRLLVEISRDEYAIRPLAAELLHSVILESSLADDSFEDFCLNLGYDTDSRKALETYLVCQENGSKIRKIFKTDLLCEIEELLQDY